MKKILVTGATGQLGQEFKFLENQYNTFEFIFFTRMNWDITDKAKSEEIINTHQPQFIINTAAYTAVDKAELEPTNCFLINDTAPAHLAQLCLKYNVKMIHYSSDYVFNSDVLIPNKEDAEKNPQGIYAQSKALGEKHILESNPNTIIFRSSWIYSSFGHNFVKTMLRLAKEKKELTVVNDQIGSPTYARDLCKATMVIVEHFTSHPKSIPNQIYHYSNAGTTNWNEFAREIFSYKKLDIKVQPISTATFNALAPRPKFSVLDCNKIKTTFGITIPFWKDQLHDCLDLLSI